MDRNTEGFEWINADDADRSIFSFVRKSPTGRNNLLFVCNFTPMARPDYRVGVPKKKKYRLILNSADPKYGGKTTIRKTEYMAEKNRVITEVIPLDISFRLMAWLCLCIDRESSGIWKNPGRRR